MKFAAIAKRIILILQLICFKCAIDELDSICCSPYDTNLIESSNAQREMISCTQALLFTSATSNEYSKSVCAVTLKGNPDESCEEIDDNLIDKIEHKDEISEKSDEMSSEADEYLENVPNKALVTNIKTQDSGSLLGKLPKRRIYKRHTASKIYPELEAYSAFLNPLASPENSEISGESDSSSGLSDILTAP
ncbi:hypothetical protein CWI38_0611p0010 [Hamiltosporidium tvaerminnensis]|uniref:Uncharacterized protein n=1 Tax=Hamiltosporidium tvaerminnensis TaxID=1176355 RepID=A0A4Q9LUW8_9MICR|nr:hypothetical protein CWI38_1232p0010 [Hamiltosporidium tvaerminnensis]TBU12828.1 hypothetical protein CWI38_0611p0010 [Hamiltosporidium tvaerminnensis]